jgi:outer membrane protein assembly factor BamB
MTRRLRNLLLLAGLAGLTLILGGCSGTTAMLTGSSWPGIAATDDAIYLAFGPHVYAIDAETQSTVWTYPEQANRSQTFYARPAVGDDLVVVTDYTDKVTALDRTTGREVWTFASDRSRFIGGAALGDGLVYAGAVNGVLYALDYDTGREVWRFSADRDIWSTPLLDGSTLYVTSLDRHVYALNASDGTLLWQFPDNGEEMEPRMGAIVGTPTLYEDVLYFGSFNNRVYALDTLTRQVLWTYNTSNWVWTSPVVDEETGLLIGGDLDGNVFGLDIATGAERWTFDAGGPVVGVPALDTREDGSRVLYVATGATETSNLHTLNVGDGTRADTSVTLKAEFTSRFLFFQTGTSERTIPIYASPVISNGMLLIGADQGNYPLYALDRETLLEEWAYTPNNS